MVKDRLSELRAVVERNDSLIVSVESNVYRKEDGLHDLYEEVELIREDIESIRTDVEEVNAIHEKILNAPQTHESTAYILSMTAISL